MSSVFQEILDSPLSSEEQRAAARKMIDAAKPKKCEPILADGRIVLPTTRDHIRDDGSSYSWGPVVISEAYAAELRKKFGNLIDGRATQWAASERLNAVLFVNGGLMTCAQALAKFPDWEVIATTE